MNSASTPERSVDEIVEEFQMKYLDVWATGVEPTLHVTDWLTQTLQAERKKRDEMVKAEIVFLKTLYVTSPTLSPEDYSDSNQELSCFQDGFDDAKGQIESKIQERIEALTQPNNPK